MSFLILISEFRSHMCGFVRFLEFMSNHDWSVEPVIVNLNDQITSKLF